MEQELQALKDELARVRAREKRFKDSAEAQITALQEQLEAMTATKNRAEAAKMELENRCRQLEEEINRLNPHGNKESTTHNNRVTDDRPFYEILRDFFENYK